MTLKVQHTDFDHLTKGLDVIGITETHASTEQDVQKQGYHHYSVIRKKATLARSHSGGVTVIVANHLFPHTKMCDLSNPCCLALKIRGSAIGQPHDLYILTVYLPPEHSSYLKSTHTDPFELLNQACPRIPQKPMSSLIGDFNAHTLTATGTTPHVPHDTLPFPDGDPPPPPRTADPWINMAPNSSNYAQIVTTLSLMDAPLATPKATIPTNAAPSGVSSIMASSPHPYGHTSETSKWASTTPSYPTTPLSYPN